MNAICAYAFGRGCTLFGGFCVYIGSLMTPDSLAATWSNAATDGPRTMLLGLFMMLLSAPLPYLLTRRVGAA